MRFLQGKGCKIFCTPKNWSASACFFFIKMRGAQTMVYAPRTGEFQAVRVEGPPP